MECNRSGGNLKQTQTPCDFDSLLLNPWVQSLMLYNLKRDYVVDTTARYL